MVRTSLESAKINHDVKDCTAVLGVGPHGSKVMLAVT